MTIKIGDPIPKSSFTVMTPQGPEVCNSEQIFKGRKVVLFGVAGGVSWQRGRVQGKRHRRRRGDER
jgi:peroxiredoxin